MASDNNAITSQPKTVTSGQLMIKPLEKDDVDFAVTMLIEIFRSKFEHAMGKDKMETLHDAFALEMNTRPEGGYDNIFVAYYEGERAGYLELKYHDVKLQRGDTSFPGIGCCCGGIKLGVFDCMGGEDKTSKERCCLQVIGVQSKFQGRGIGKALMLKTEQEARERGYKKIYLDVVGGNTAIHLYEKQGYTIKSTKNSCLFNWATGYSVLHEMEKSLE